MDITKNIRKFIFDRNIVSIAMEYHICRTCKIVDTSPRIFVGSLCPTCQNPNSEGGLMFFDSSVLTLISLLQSTYRAIPKRDSAEEPFPTKEEHAHSASVIIFFCILKEILLERFLTLLMQSQKLPELVCKRLLADHNSHTQKLSRLLPAIVGISWDEAISSLSTENEVDFIRLNTFLKNVTDLRNDFVHDGLHHFLNNDVADQCIDWLFPLLKLYVSLNNKFIHPLYFQRAG